MHRLASRLENIAPFHVMELVKMAARLESEGRDIIHLAIGEPDFGAAQPVMDAAARAMADGRMQYTAATGLPALREAISQHYRERYQLDIAPHRVIVTAGASAALLLTCAALVEEGTEVLMPDPSYPCNRHFVAAFEGVAKLVPSGPEQRFQLSEATVREHWSSATGGVLLATPSNPTGTSIAREELAKIISAVRELGGFTIVDEIYQELSYDSAPFSALAMADDIIVINSFSKYFNMTGWRLGWMVVPEALLPAVEKLAQNLFICPSSLAQHAALACFTPEAMAMFAGRKDEFKRRRDYLVPALRELGFSIPVMPDGAFYVYADCSALTDDANQFSLDLLNEVGVALVPGQDFGPHTARRYVRISYATSLEKLQDAVSRIGTFLRDHPRNS